MMPDIEGVRSGPSKPISGGVNWKLAGEQRNDLVHDYPCRGHVGRHVASPKDVF